LTSYKQRQEHKHIQFDVNFSVEALIIFASIDELRRALMNVIDNAIKYTPDNGQVVINVDCKDDEAIITVIDSGIGIPESELEQVFNRFYRADNAQEAAPGTGLGLEISQRIIEAHHGKIEVKSELGRGSTFAISLPLSPEQS
jgi:two-component system phosphate regulon sensor histidine kinase PhoR